MSADGDFGPRNTFTSDYYYAYFNCWVILGAQRLGQYDLAHRGMEFLLNFQDEKTGGFFSSPTERLSTTRQDLWVTSGCGQAALCTGRLDVARGVGRWMQQMLDEQPNYPEELYTVSTAQNGLLTDIDPDDSLRCILRNVAEGDQYFFHPGIAGGFLARLCQASGEQQWLHLACQYMRFAETATDNLFGLLRAGKVGWAASVLYQLTGEQKYRDIAVRVGDNLVAQQADDGSWSAVGFEAADNDMTAEMVVWLDEIHQVVGRD